MTTRKPFRRRRAADRPPRSQSGAGRDGTPWRHLGWRSVSETDHPDLEALAVDVTASAGPRNRHGMPIELTIVRRAWPVLTLLAVTANLLVLPS